MGALEVYAKANQAAIISPFIVGGAMAPVTVAGTLDPSAGRSSGRRRLQPACPRRCPVIFGAFVTSIDMNSGAPTFGTPEAAHITYGAGQLGRRLGAALPLGRVVLRIEAARCTGGLRDREQPEHGTAGGRELHAACLRLAGGRPVSARTRNS